MEFNNLLQAIGSLLAFVIVYKAWRRIVFNTKTQGKPAPEPLGAWPLIGHLHLLGGQIPVCRTLAAMADKHGPVFTIRLGMKRGLVVSSWEVAKEVYTTNDQVFLSRPSNAASVYMGYDNALFGFCPYGPYWRHIRKLATLELLTNRRIELLKNVRASEVDTCIKDLYKLCTKNGKACSTSMVDMSKWFSCVAMNMIIRMIAGKRYSTVEEDEESERFVKAIKDFMYLSGVLVVSDVIPCMEWLDLKGYVKSMKQNAKELDYFMSTWLEEHVRNRKYGKVVEERDFMDAMLSLLADDYENDLIFGFKMETVIKATASNLIIGGADTTYLTLTWALSLLLNHVEVLKAAQEELDTHVGRERWVEESDLKNLVQLQAIVKETLRLYPAGPLSGLREAMEDCHVSGYHIPRGTRLLVNVWKVHRDPRFWKDPDEFKPERFLTSHADIDYRGQHFQYIPFSSGRRACPGIASGVLMVSLILARVLQGFNLTTPRNEPVDMSEGLGLTLPKATPLEVVLSLRLSHLLYQP